MRDGAQRLFSVNHPQTLYPCGFQSECPGASDGIRTHDLLFTKQLLYP